MLSIYTKIFYFWNLQIRTSKLFIAISKNLESDDQESEMILRNRLQRRGISESIPATSDLSRAL